MTFLLLLPKSRRVPSSLFVLTPDPRRTETCVAVGKRVHDPTPHTFYFLFT